MAGNLLLERFESRKKTRAWIQARMFTIHVDLVPTKKDLLWVEIVTKSARIGVGVDVVVAEGIDSAIETLDKA